MINNAKLEVKRSKAALQSLYRQQKAGFTPGGRQLDNATAGSMILLHPMSHAAGVQTSFKHTPKGRTPEGESFNASLADPPEEPDPAQERI